MRCGQHLLPELSFRGFWQQGHVSPFKFVRTYMASEASLWLCLRLAWAERRRVWVRLRLRE